MDSFDEASHELSQISGTLIRKFTVHQKIQLAKLRAHSGKLLLSVTTNRTVLDSKHNLQAGSLANLYYCQFVTKIHLGILNTKAKVSFYE